MTLLSCIAGWPSLVAACDNPLARVVSIEGQVQRSDCGNQPWCDAVLQMPVCDGQRVRTGAHSRAAIQLTSDASVLRLDQYTTLLVESTDQASRGLLLELFEGAVNLFSRTPSSLLINTSFIAAAIKGTEFQVRTFDNSSRIDLFEGVVEASNSEGSLTLHAGQSALAVAGKPPRLMALVDPIDAVQWSLYYTPLIATLAGRDGDGTEADAVRVATRGDLIRALQELDGVPKRERLPSWHIVRAAILLSVGRVDRAQTELDAAETADPGIADAAALRAVIALTRGSAGDARQALARRASNSAAVWLVESYLRQNAGRLPKALAATRQALELQPNNALLIAREAELLLTEGRLGNAVARAEQSLEITGDVPLGHIVLGFAYLAERRPQAAETAFDRALQLDQGDPLPRLGLGLAAISQGRLQAGTEELEIAVALDPRRSLLRSYLGNAYFEQNRNALARDQFLSAETLDPLDPKPWFYLAPLLLSENRPIEALDALVRAVDLNDNRAVYRSRPLLEQDRAARYATMGSLFSELNFDELALPAGTRATAQAPAEPGGHFLLADLYNEQPRREVARVSEYLQARLLSPVSSRPVQPLLTQTRLTIPNGLGPANLSLFEYGSLFDQDGGRAWVSAAAGSQQSIGDELLFSFLQGPFAFSLGQYRYQDEGYRPNNDQQRDLISAFAQWDVTPFTSIQAEISHSSLNSGDLASYFLPDAFSPNRRSDLMTNNYRLGLRQRFGPQLVLLGSLIDSHERVDLRDSAEDRLLLPPPFGLSQVRANAELKSQDDGLSAEFRWLWSQPMLTVDFGGGNYQVDASRDERTTTIISSPQLPQPRIASQPRSFSNRSDHDRLYLYTGIEPWQALRLELGLSWENFNDRLLNFKRQLNAFNPKLGLTWEPQPGTTLRAATFRTLQRPMVTYQTIEPTQIAGFNQLFQDTTLDQARHVGLAFDQRFGSRLFLGAWHTRQRNDTSSVTFNVDGITTETLVVERKFDTERNQTTGYLYWAPIDSLALAAEYHRETWEKFDPEPAFRVDTRTQRVPLTGSLFLRNGLSIVARATHVNQRLIPNPAKAPEVNDHNGFWNLDLGFYWRLQKRKGFLSINVLNLLDEQFAYEDQDSNRPLFVPERTLALRASLKFD